MYFVYPVTSSGHCTHYLCIANDLMRHIHQHKIMTVAAECPRYGVSRPLWYEACNDPKNPSRAKKLSKMTRRMEIGLSEEHNLADIFLSFDRWADRDPGPTPWRVENMRPLANGGDSE